MTLGSFVTLVIIAVIIVLMFVILGALPGKVARERGHSQADAINVLGWAGLLLGLLPWLAALIWAYAKPLTVVAATPVDATDVADDGNDDRLDV
jgi:multisubunit Na+/H+ antiporter MnhB subunit